MATHVGRLTGLGQAPRLNSAEGQWRGKPNVWYTGEWLENDVVRNTQKKGPTRKTRVGPFTKGGCARGSLAYATMVPSYNG